MICLQEKTYMSLSFQLFSFQNYSKRTKDGLKLSFTIFPLSPQTTQHTLGPFMAWKDWDLHPLELDHELHSRTVAVTDNTQSG